MPDSDFPLAESVSLDDEDAEVLEELCELEELEELDEFEAVPPQPAKQTSDKAQVQQMAITFFTLIIGTPFTNSE